MVASLLALACGRGEPAGTSRPQAGAGGTGPSSNDGGGGSPGTGNGGGGSPGTAGGGGGSPSTGGGSNAAVPCNGNLILRIAVNDLGSLQSLDLGLAGITLQGTSGALAADFTRTGQISLPAMNDRLAVLKMPTGDVDVAVQLDTARACTGTTCTFDAGVAFNPGTRQADGATGVLDAGRFAAARGAFPGVGAGVLAGAVTAL